MTKDVLTQDNDPFTFTTLGAATLNVVRWLQKDRDQEPHGSTDESPEDKTDKQRERESFLETRLREIERFERSFKPRYRNY